VGLLFAAAICCFILSLRALYWAIAYSLGFSSAKLDGAAVSDSSFSSSAFVFLRMASNFASRLSCVSLWSPSCRKEGCTLSLLSSRFEVVPSGGNALRRLRSLRPSSRPWAMNRVT